MRLAAEGEDGSSSALRFGAGVSVSIAGAAGYLEACRSMGASCGITNHLLLFWKTSRMVMPRMRLPYRWMATAVKQARGAECRRIREPSQGSWQRNPGVLTSASAFAGIRISRAQPRVSSPAPAHLTPRRSNCASPPLSRPYFRVFSIRKNCGSAVLMSVKVRHPSRSGNAAIDLPTHFSGGMRVKTMAETLRVIVLVHIVSTSP